MKHLASGSKLLAWWTATGAWALQIFWMSTSTFGGETTRSMLLGLLDAIGLALPEVMLSALHSLSRKAAHIGEYAVFGLLLYQSLSRRWVAAAIVAAAVYAATDECHQLFVAGRHASLFDWGLDVAAAASAIGAVRLSLRMRKGSGNANATPQNA